ncbi:hypothetical protein JT27_18335 [Alcaligenes faecalis]|uniref:DnaB-like helicase C-terminal domain-containing protein n=1 Tax=Alcaligenes faecalis TaxID=511 RepID=UPI00052D87AC|nr:DnaB-like helicase C-terminal domain-containing protein [Alcaligenes faecalis]KGP00289.1 hypothetical protein JT27_18335 [Alcaligenes faecalis]
MSDGLKLISACIAECNPGALLKIPQDGWIEGPETRAMQYVAAHMKEYRVLPHVSTIQENTGVRMMAAREDVDYYIRAVLNRRANRIAKEHYKDLRSALEGTTSESIAQVREAALAIAEATRSVETGTSLLTMSDMATVLAERNQKLREAGTDLIGIPTGLLPMDEVTMGLQPADVISVIARTGLGKTIMMVLHARAAVEAGKRVLFVTTEMSALQIILRYAAQAWGYSPSVLKSGKLSTKVERELLERMQDAGIQDKLLTHEAGFGTNTGKIESLVAEVQPDLLCIDGAYLIKPVGRAHSRVEAVATSSDEIKAISLVHKTATIASYQFNRGATNKGKDGGLEHVAMSDAIVNNSSIVYKLTQGPSDDPERSRQITSMKGRDGEDFDFAINWIFHPTMNLTIYQEDDIYGARAPQREGGEGEEGHPDDDEELPRSDFMEEGLGI